MAYLQIAVTQIITQCMLQSTPGVPTGGQVTKLGESYPEYFPSNLNTYSSDQGYIKSFPSPYPLLRNTILFVPIFLPTDHL